jgi:hypothetical protein
VGDFAAPTLFDLDNDGFTDLIVGEKRSGRLYYYRSDKGNISAKADTLKGVDVRDENYSNFGYGVPAFYRNEQNDVVLLCGSEQGIIYEYRQNTDGTFKRTAEYSLSIGKFSAPAAANYSHIAAGEAKQSLIAGNIRGGLQLFDLNSLPSAGNEPQVKTPSAAVVTVAPNPVTDGILNVLSQERSQYVIYNLQGKILQSGTLSQGANTIRLRTARSGVYLLYVKTHSTVNAVKFIVN